MYHVTFVQENGVERRVEVDPGQTLMDAARSSAVEGILADCGGACACATCHVLIDAEWQSAVGGPNSVEESALELVSENVQPNSRLSCQIVFKPELDGLRVTVFSLDV